ncbi:hypothetical protein WEI85_20185 [Actinomycetes bacterium KLBMP 9797]
MLPVTPWPYNDQPAGLALPDFGLPADEGARLRDRIWALLLSGRDDPDYFAVVEGGQWAALTHAQLVEAFAHARQARVRQQAQWAGQEVRTNLDLAFDDLNAAGIVARQDFTCCGTCGAAEIEDEADDSRHWRGYVFYHQQDTPGLADEGSVYLSYGVFPPDSMDVREFVNTEVVPRLTARGLDVEWNTDLGTRILVRGAQWYAHV